MRLVRKIHTVGARIVFLLMLMVAFSSVANADELRVETDPSKIWTVEFNEPLYKDSVNGSSIYVLIDGSDEVFPIDINIIDETKLTVSPQGDYEYDQIYHLVITKAVQSDAGIYLKNEVTMPFKIFGEPEESGKDEDQNTDREGHQDDQQNENEGEPPGEQPKDDIAQVEATFVVGGVQIGDSEEKVIQLYGQPLRKDMSEYGFEWYIFHENYHNYLQVGILDGLVVALFTNHDLIESTKQLKLFSSKEDVRQQLGDPITYITKGNVKYNQIITEGYDLFFIDDYYVTVFYDLHEGSTITSVQLIEENVEKTIGFYGTPSEALQSSFEKQMLDIVNAMRVRFGLKAFSWDPQTAETARNHSTDMATNGFFSHYNLAGESPFDRMNNDGISYRTAGENLAYGQPSPIFAHEGLMNSLGHRRNLLNTSFEQLGVGVDFNDLHHPYYTQKFFAN